MLPMNGTEFKEFFARDRAFSMQAGLAHHPRRQFQEPLTGNAQP
jgi:hypothetical protein